MVVPDWYSLALIGLGAWSVFELLGNDVILERPRAWVLKKMRDEEYWQAFITCPFCAGFWIFLAWFGAWQFSHHWTEIAAVAIGGRAIVVGLHAAIGPE